MHRRTFPCRHGTVTQPRLGVSLERLQLESQAVPRYILPPVFRCDGVSRIRTLIVRSPHTFNLEDHDGNYSVYTNGASALRR